MSDKTKIEWTDATWNVINGCSVISAGCTNCYAMKLAGTRLKHTPSREGLTDMTKAGPVWNGQVRFNEHLLTQPLTWRRPRRIFVCAHGDLFHENVPDAWIDQVFAVMAMAPHHTFQVLTKRPERMRQYLTTRQREFIISAAQVTIKIPTSTTGRWPHLPLPNVWLGVSIEDQRSADARVPDLLRTPAAVRFVSAEPLLGQVTLRQYLMAGFDPGHCANCGRGHGFNRCPNYGGVSKIRSAYEDGPVTCPEFKRSSFVLHWVIAGGESGPNARPVHPDWIRSLRDQCAAAGVPFFFKQWGAWHPDALLFTDTQGRCPPPNRMIGKKAAGDLLDGVRHHNWPEVA